LLRAYRQTHYRAGDVDIRIGSCVPDHVFERLGLREATLITAWNPMSRRMPAGWNRRMQRRLADRLRHIVTMPADGMLRRWHEAHVLAAKDSRWVAHLAHLFRQRGIVVIRRGQRARLVLLR